MRLRLGPNPFSRKQLATRPLNDPLGSPQKFKTYPKAVPDAKIKNLYRSYFFVLRLILSYRKSGPASCRGQTSLTEGVGPPLTLAAGGSRRQSTTVPTLPPGRPHIPPHQGSRQYRPSLGPFTSRGGLLAPGWKESNLTEAGDHVNDLIEKYHNMVGSQRAPISKSHLRPER
jgi:hypothetical protein